jgi:hypothetical protein
MRQGSMMRQGLVVAACVLVGAMEAQAQARTGGQGLSAIDYYEIQQLYSRFCHGLDSGADGGRMFASVFTSDGVYVDTAGKSMTGPDQLAAYARQDIAGLKGPTNVAHFTTNIALEPTAPNAVTGTAYLVVTSPGGRGGAGRGVVDGGVVRDELVKTADGWRIRRRTVTRDAAAAVR